MGPFYFFWTVFSNCSSCIGGFGPFEALGDPFPGGPLRPGPLHLWNHFSSPVPAHPQRNTDPLLCCVPASGFGTSAAGTTPRFPRAGLAPNYDATDRPPAHCSRRAAHFSLAVDPLWLVALVLWWKFPLMCLAASPLPWSAASVRRGLAATQT